ncbi:MAG: winged helix-turn-helix domain-containing protein [Candidatus Bathyarchaeota archaeon]|nr:winged helix-turn-helix domain-containing protein [Candidatus Bathyarchaeota archaeon]
MSDSGEETYSIMFTSLKHPARRRILRMLAEKPKNFSRILEELGISSSHLTYHLENLGELVTKLDDGRYKLSAFGKAAVMTMQIVEDTPDIQPKTPTSFPLKWKTVFGVLMIAIVLMAGLSYTQFLSLNEVAAEQDLLQEEFDKLQTAHERLLRWGISTDRVINFLKDVIQLDLSKYQARLERNTVEYRPDLGGVVEEVLAYTLLTDNSELGVDFRFRNQTLSRYRLDYIEGLPVYYEQQPIDLIESAKGLIDRYQNYAGISYLTPMKNMLDTISNVENTAIIMGDLKLEIITDGPDTQFQWMYTTEGIGYQAKGLTLNYDNGVLEMFTDGWFLFTVGSTEVNISELQAIQIAIAHVNEFSWSVNDVTISEFDIVESEVTAELWPHLREDNLELIPYWYVTIPLDKVYPLNVDRLAVGIWADTGEITEYRTIRVGSI